MPITAWARQPGYRSCFVFFSDHQDGYRVDNIVRGGERLTPYKGNDRIA